MRALIRTLLALALVATACGDDSADTTASTAGPGTTESATTAGTTTSPP